MSVLAQDGSGPSTKLTSGLSKDEIDGAILSLMARTPDNLEACIEQLQADYPNKFFLLDTHFHASAFADTDKFGKITKYGLFDMNISAFNFRDPSTVRDSVESVLEYQLSLGLSNLTTPSLVMQEFDDANSQVSLNMYEESIKQVNKLSRKKIYLTLVFSEQALNQKNAMTQFLNSLCLLDADGFYIVVERQKSDNGMWSSSDTLASLMYFINSLHQNEYEVVVGYTDLYGVLLKAVGADYVGSGWFQTLRQYSRNFYVNSRGGSGSPLYPSEMLLSTLYVNPDLMTIVERTAPLAVSVVDAKYGSQILANPRTAAWTNEAYALQHWCATKNVNLQFSNDVEDNLNKLIVNIEEATNLFSQIRAHKIAINERHDGRHLGVWKKAIEKYRNGVL